MSATNHRLAFEGLRVGRRCTTRDGRDGTIRWLGENPVFERGLWVGVELDDPTGKNDGSRDGVAYFTCKANRGIFIRPTQVTQGEQETGAGKRASSSLLPSSSSRLSTVGASSATARALPKPAGQARSGTAPAPAAAAVKPPLRSTPSAITKPSALTTKSSLVKPTSTITKPATTAIRPTAAVLRRPSSISGPSITAAANKTNRLSSSGGVSGISTVNSASRNASSNVTRPSNLATQTSSRDISQATRSSSLATKPIALPSVKPAEQVAIMPAAEEPPKASTAELEAKIRKLEALEASRADEVSSFQELIKVRTERDRLQAALKTIQATYTTQRTEIRQLRVEVQDTSRRAEDMEAELAKAQHELGEERTRREDSEMLHQGLKLDIELLKLEADDQEDKTEDKVKFLENRIGQLADNVEYQRKRADSESSRASDEQQLREELKREYKALDEERSEIFEESTDRLMENTELFMKNMDLELDVFDKGLELERMRRIQAKFNELQNKNKRLQDAIIALRDLTSEQHAELREDIERLEDDAEVHIRTKAMLDLTKNCLFEAEGTIDDLRQQLDAASSAEEMIQEITDQNMNKTEEIEQLKATIEELEILREVSDELEVNHVQNEKELRGEIELRDSVIVEQVKHINHQEQSLDEQNYAVSRFRELVSTLQSDLQDMRASQSVTETESGQLSERSRAMEELTMKLQSTTQKAQAKTIDIELRILDTQEAKEHLEIVKLFLPDTFDSGKDSVLALLRLRRIGFKANLLSQFVRESINGQSHVGHENETLSGCDVMDKLAWVAASSRRFVDFVEHCTLSEFAKFDGVFYELDSVERALSTWINELMRDELKFAQCAADLQRLIALMTHLGEVYITRSADSRCGDMAMASILMLSHLESAAITITTTQSMIQRTIPQSGQDDDLAQYFSQKMDAAIRQTRSAKMVAGRTVAELEELRLRSLSLPLDTLAAFERCETASLELVTLVRDIGLGLYNTLCEEGRAKSFTYVDVQQSIDQTVAATGAPTETDLLSTYFGKLKSVKSQLVDLSELAADMTQAHELDRNGAPWVAWSEEIKASKAIPLDAEERLRLLREEVAEARRALVQRDATLSTATLKIETLESRMRDSNATASLITALESKLDSAANMIKALHRDIEQQERELKSLEADRDQWKGVAELAGDATAAGLGTHDDVGSFNEAANRLVELEAELQSLRRTVVFLRKDNIRAREESGQRWLLAEATPLRGVSSLRATDKLFALKRLMNGLSSDVIEVIGE